MKSILKQNFICSIRGWNAPGSNFSIPLQFGPSYGRKTTKGLLAAQGIRVGEKQVGAALRRVSSRYHSTRTSLARQRTNPVPYSADYFGQKVHVDQNKKLVMFGCTHACAVDGYSGMIVGFMTMPTKTC